MKLRKAIIVFAASLMAIVTILAGCQSGPSINVKELDNKGNSTGGVTTPDWVTLYSRKGITAVQSQPEYKNHYCIVGEARGTNKEFVLAWADNFSAQDRIGAMLRTNIASKYQAAANGQEQSSGSSNSTSAASGNSGEFQREIQNAINAVVNVSYSGAQREADWWVLNRRYDPDQKNEYSDEYTAHVMYTIPKAELNRQIANALETSTSKDSVLYDITIQLAKDILLNGVDYLDPAAE